MGFMIYAILFIVLLVFILTFAIIFSPKARGKMMSNQIKSMKYMMDESKDDIKNVSTNMADATKDGIRITANAIKKGLTKEETYCKHCSSIIDKDSKYCKNCGKEQ